MGQISLLWNWGVIRPWPVWIPLVLTLTVLVVGWKYPRYRRRIYGYSGRLMAIVGISVTLFGLNQKMTTLQGRSMATYVREWRDQFPLISRSAQVTLSGVQLNVTTAAIAVTTDRPASTLEDRLSRLEEEIKRIKTDLSNRSQATSADIDLVSAKVSGLGAAIEKGVIGDFRWPLFAGLISLAGIVILLLEHVGRPSDG